jgi:FMN phosphatase YigB (HAD superfamily)
MKSFKALLLDLDGTLLDIDMSFFLGPLVDEMHDFFSDVMGYVRFRKGLFGGTEEIMSTPRPDGETNRDGFFQAFEQITGLSPTEAEGRFEKFYATVFPALGAFTHPVEGGVEFVTRAAQSGYVMGLATNPIFPVSATLERVRWAGIDPRLFTLVPGLENMSSCKPSGRYFLEVASRMGCEPESCLMVGNDLEQDLPAADVGMGTYIVEGRVIGRKMSGRKPDARGTLEELAELLGME